MNGEKEWEIRSCRTLKRGPISIAVSKTQTLIGEVEIIDCIEVDEVLLQNNFCKHKASQEMLSSLRMSSGVLYAWVLTSAHAYSKPEPYVHPTGAITWVDLKKRHVP